MAKRPQWFPAAVRGYRLAMRRGFAAVCSIAIAVLALAGCATGGTGANVSQTSVQRGPSAVVIPMMLVRGTAGPVALVRLTIKGRGYLFKLDTGAARTVIGAGLAKRLSLGARGAAFSTPTVGCSTVVQLVGIADWRLGARPLPAMTIASIKTLNVGPSIHGTPISGLLGSDVLSRFGSITVSFAAGRLILGSRAPTGGHPVAATVEHPAHGGTFVTVRAVIGGQPATYVIDTGASTPLIEGHLTSRLGLHVIDRPLKAVGAAGCSEMVTPVRIDQWTTGAVRLPPSMALSTHGSSYLTGLRIAGVIGTNVLAAFGETTIEFTHKRVVLGPAAEHG